MATDCHAWREDLSALLDDELAAERTAELRGHLAGCADCREELAALRRADAELAALAAPPLPDDLRARLQARIDAEGSDGAARLPGRAAPRRPRRWGRAPLWAAALAAGVALAWVLVAGPERAPLSPEPLREAPEIARVEPPAPAPVPEAGPEGEVPEPEPVRIAERAEPAPASVPPATELPDTELARVLEEQPAEDLALALEWETVEDLEVIANLELLEALVAMEEGAG